MKNNYRKFLESFLDEFSKTNSIDSVTEKTDNLFTDLIELQSTSILNRLMKKEDRSWDSIAAMKPKRMYHKTDSGQSYMGQREIPDERIGDITTKFDASTWGDQINFDDAHIGQVVQHKKSKRKGVVIRSDEMVHRTPDDNTKFKTGGKNIPRPSEVPPDITGWEPGKGDPVYDRSVFKSSDITDHAPFGDVRVAVMKPDGTINPHGKLKLWFAQDYEPTGEEVDVPKLVATAVKSDRVRNRAPSWKSKPRKAGTAIKYRRGEDGSWELANPEDFDEETRSELIAKMKRLPDEISADQIERWRKKEEAKQIEKNARDSGFVSQYMNYGDQDDKLDPDL